MKTKLEELMGAVLESSKSSKENMDFGFLDMKKKMKLEKKMKKKKRREAAKNAEGSQKKVEEKSELPSLSPLLLSTSTHRRRSSLDSDAAASAARGGAAAAAEMIVVAKSASPGNNAIGPRLATKRREKRLAMLNKLKERKKKQKQKKKDAVAESAPTPVEPSSTATTPQSSKKKKKKKKRKKAGMDGETAVADMKPKSQVDSNGNAVVKTTNGEEEPERVVDSEWSKTKSFEPAKKEGKSAEHQPVKSTKKQRKQQRAAVIDRPPEPTVPENTVLSPCPTVAHDKCCTAPNFTIRPKSSPATVPSPSPKVSHPMRDTVRQSNGITSGVRSPSKPTHIRFASESPVKTSLPSPAKSIDNERSEKEVEGKQMNGKRKRDSSPEVSTTSSESDVEERKEAERRKKLTKKLEVTSSKTAKDSKMTSSRAVEKKVDEKSIVEEVVTSSGKKAKKERRKDKKKKKRGVIEVKEPEPEKEEQEEPVRHSPDVLQMIAERLANCHGLLVFRVICRETRRIADRQLRSADNVLHLEEFDDENAFTRDDMTQWWEERREAEDTSIGEGKENRAHAQISAYLKARALEKNLLRDMDGGMSHPSSAAAAVDPVQLLQHPLETLDGACLLHESQDAAVRQFLQQEGKQLREVWLGHCNKKLVTVLPRLKAIERFEHRQATLKTMEALPMLQITELRLDFVDDEITRASIADHLVNGQNIRALELNIAPIGHVDGNTASHYNLFTKRSYDRGDYTDDLEWMMPNVEEGEPDPVTLCMPSLEHLATNVGNVKLFWQLRDSTLLLRHLLSLRVGTLSRTKELIASSEMFADTKESRRYKQPGFFSLRDAYETELESVTLRLSDRVGMCRLQRETATMFEAIGELPPSLRRLSISLFYNQFSGVCAPFRKWAEPDVEAPDTDHIGIEEMHLHFERAFDLRGLPVLLPRSIKKLSIAVNYETEDDAKCLGPFVDMLKGLERLENLEDLHIQVWGVRCLEPLVARLSSFPSLAKRLTRLAVAAYPVDDGFFEGINASSFLRSSLAYFPHLHTLGLHAAVLVRMIPEERRSGYSWRNGLAWLANESFGGFVKGKADGEYTKHRLDSIELVAATALPMLDDGEDYTIVPHWEVDYNAKQLVLSPEDEEEREEIEDTSYSIPHGTSDEDDDFITDGEDEDHMGDASHDDLERMEERLEDETERIERRESRRDEKVRAAIERGELPEGEEEEEGDLFNFDSISDEEEEEPQKRSEFFDDEAAESDREESEDEGEEEEEDKHEESADSWCSSEDDDDQREEERLKEEGRRQKRLERKQAKLDTEVENRKRKRTLESEDEEDDEIVIRRRAPNKKKKVIIDSDEE